MNESRSFLSIYIWQILILLLFVGMIAYFSFAVDKSSLHWERKNICFEDGWNYTSPDDQTYAQGKQLTGCNIEYSDEMETDLMRCEIENRTIELFCVSRFSIERYVK